MLDLSEIKGLTPFKSCADLLVLPQIEPQLCECCKWYLGLDDSDDNNNKIIYESNIHN